MGKNKEFIENQFKKGEVRNPAGRPKKENTYSDTLRSLLEGQDIEVTWTVNGKKKNLTVSSDKNLYYGVASAQIMEALKGNIQAQKEIIDRIQGKAPQTLTVNEKVENLDDKLRGAADLLDEAARSGKARKPD